MPLRLLICCCLLCALPVQALTIAMVLWRGETDAERGFRDELNRLGHHPTFVTFNANQDRTALATLLLRRGDAAGALRLAEALVRQRPDEPAAHNLLGVVRAANRQPEAARSAYNQALALAPALLPAQLNLARLDAAEGRVDAARRRLGDLLRKDGGQAQALTELGRLERAAGRLAEARPLLEKAHKLAPADQAAGTELLALYQQLGDAPAALRVAKQLAQARPDDPAADTEAISWYQGASMLYHRTL